MMKPGVRLVGFQFDVDYNYAINLLTAYCVALSDLLNNSSVD